MHKIFSLLKQKERNEDMSELLNKCQASTHREAGVEETAVLAKDPNHLQPQFYNYCSILASAVYRHGTDIHAGKIPIHIK